MSVISIIIVYFQLGIEIVSFTFMLQIVTKVLISFFLFRSFHLSLINFTIGVAFKFFFLLSIHVIKYVIYYLIMDTAFVLIVLAFVYLYEYMTRKFYYSFLKLAKEKEYFLETMNFFNISYFMSRNGFIKKEIKLDYLLNCLNSNDNDRSTDSKKFFSSSPNTSNSKYSLRCIEEILKNLYLVEPLPKEVQNYFLNSKNKQNFKFKKLIRVLNNKENKNCFKKFANVGVIKMRNDTTKEDIYIQCFLKIRIKNNYTDKSYLRSTDINSDEKKSWEKEDNEFFDEGIDVRIEGIFLEVTQNYLKKETQLNSYILSKYIHDIKTPLFILEQLTTTHKSNMNNYIMEKESKTNSRNLTGGLAIIPDTIYSEVKEYSRNLKMISNYIFEIIKLINNFTKIQNNFIPRNSIQSNLAISDGEISTVNIRKLINQCVDYYKIYLNFNPIKKDIKIFTDIENSIPNYIYINKQYLKQILMNLLSNAVKYTYHGEIKIVCKVKSRLEITDEKKFIEINVIDSGIGIEKENVGKLCKPFGLSTNSFELSSGLGLSIVNDILQTMNSTLNIYSIKNKGSNFSFEIPLEKANTSLKDIRHSSNSILIPKKEEANLRVDDNFDYEDDDNKTVICNIPFNKNDFKFYTEEDHYELITAENLEKESQNLVESQNKKRHHSLANIEKLKADSEIKLLNKNAVIRRHSYKDFFKIFNKHNSNSEKNLISQLSNKNQEKLSFYKIIQNFIFTDVNNFNNNNINNNNFITLPPVKKNMINILIIDDDAIYLQQFSKLVKHCSNILKLTVGIDTAFDPILSLFKIYSTLKNNNEFYDFVFIDENMPFMKGSEFTKFYSEELANNGFYKIKFISTSSESISMPGTENNNNKAKFFYDLLSKPIKKTELTDIFLKFYHLKKKKTM
jgi:signal transduction histidine kinase